MSRTFAFGDLHGGLDDLEALLERILPQTRTDDTLVFLGDFVDRGPASAQVVRRLRQLPEVTPAKVVCLRGSHEDAWLKVLDKGFPEFILPTSNGCLATLRSYTGGPAVEEDEGPEAEEFLVMLKGGFFPPEDIAWMRTLLPYYEDEHGIYVHAGLPDRDGVFVHPRDLADPSPLFWERSERFFHDYVGKRVIFGHTMAPLLPQDKSLFTPEKSDDAYITPHLAGIDTGCGHGGFLTVVEFPELLLYESRQ